jgi:hypothetical protein
LKGARDKFEGRWWALLLAIFVAGGARSAAGAELDESKLPRASSVRVDFTRDIKPILDTSCIRCHGPEKPKSRYRLDNREAALKGGDDGIDILPGNSGKSPLIHYVARLVPDLEMPPKGKGDPLTTQQIGLLRAWIDQGVTWNNTAPSNRFDVTISPSVGWILVKGDKQKFREHYWRSDEFDAGLERFDLFEQIDPNTGRSLYGHAFRNDYKVALDLDRNEVGFIHTGWEQYRKYYDDTGGYFARETPQAPLSLGRDLHLDMGRAWIDFGLTLPRWPRMVLGYEYDYKHGDEATTSWGADGVPDPRNIAPNSKYLREATHIIKFDLDGEVQGVTIEDRFRGEFYTLNTHYTNLASRASVTQDASEKDHWFQGANSIRLEKPFKEWLFASGGYFYSKLNAHNSFTDATTDNNNQLYLAVVPQVDRTRESHVFNLNALLGPFDGFTLSSGAQAEWTREHSIGGGDLNGIAFTRPPGFINLAINPATLLSDYDRNVFSETIGLRYTKIPFTTLFADARLQQEKVGQTDMDLQPAATSFVENPRFTSSLTDFRAGFNTSPWERVSLSAHYRRYENSSHYKTNEPAQPEGGYPGFLRSRDLLTDEIEAKVVLRPLSWLKTTLSYQFLTTDYSQDTNPAFDPGPPPALN